MAGAAHTEPTFLNFNAKLGEDGQTLTLEIVLDRYNKYLHINIDLARDVLNQDYEERMMQEQAERERAEREQAEREQAEREQAEREQAERERAERDREEQAGPDAEGGERGRDREDLGIKWMKRQWFRQRRVKTVINTVLGRKDRRRGTRTHR